jgi:hypothetical protein
MHQRVAQFPQFGPVCSLFNGGRDVFSGASDLVDAVGQLRGLLGGQYHSIRRERGALDQRALFVGALPAGLPAVLPTPPQADVSDFTTTPATRLSAKTTYHENRL